MSVNELSTQRCTYCGIGYLKSEPDPDPTTSHEFSSQQITEQSLESMGLEKQKRFDGSRTFVGDNLEISWSGHDWRISISSRGFTVGGLLRMMQILSQQ